ncbi:MAG: hypothetical protein IPI32_11625 [Austwickia sp.]|nr:hypothetical protein [Austwickia sp.]
MRAGPTRGNEVRYVDESGAVTVTTNEAIDLQRAVRSTPGSRHLPREGHRPQQRQDYAQAPGGHWWTALAGALPHDRHVDVDRLWVAAFDPVDRWIIARPLRGRGGSSRSAAPAGMLGWPDGDRGAPQQPARAGGHGAQEGSACCPELATVADSVRGHAHTIGVGWVGSLVHAAAGGLGAVGRQLLKRSGLAW